MGIKLSENYTEANENTKRAYKVQHNPIQLKTTLLLPKLNKTLTLLNP